MRPSARALTPRLTLHCGGSLRGSGRVLGFGEDAQMAAPPDAKLQVGRRTRFKERRGRAPFSAASESALVGVSPRKRLFPGRESKTDYRLRKRVSPCMYPYFGGAQVSCRETCLRDSPARSPAALGPLGTDADSKLRPATLLARLGAGLVRRRRRLQRNRKNLKAGGRRGWELRQESVDFLHKHKTVGRSLTDSLGYCEGEREGGQRRRAGRRGQGLRAASRGTPRRPAGRLRELCRRLSCRGARGSARWPPGSSNPGRRGYILGGKEPARASALEPAYRTLCTRPGFSDDRLARVTLQDSAPRRHPAPSDPLGPLVDSPPTPQLHHQGEQPQIQFGIFLSKPEPQSFCSTLDLICIYF
ncbi:TPA: hypothetical protein BOS_8598 [Bos taurus]|nr:TPA: hypothetical protein BOS_8598 [Bos taurus]